MVGRKGGCGFFSEMKEAAGRLCSDSFRLYDLLGCGLCGRQFAFSVRHEFPFFCTFSVVRAALGDENEASASLLTRTARIFVLLDLKTAALTQLCPLSLVQAERY